MARPYLGNPKYTIEVLKSIILFSRKRFGQNFLIDEHVLEKIIESSGITKDDFILEIGPGIGTNDPVSCGGCQRGGCCGDRQFR